MEGLQAMDFTLLATSYNLDLGSIGQGQRTERYLSDLETCFYDLNSYQQHLQQANPLVYTVSSIEPGQGDGDLHYGLGVLYPGKIGDEYFMTKGHYHAWRPAAEVYIGLRGQGMMLLEQEHSDQVELLPLGAGNIVYVPGHTAHRTMNTGSEPLMYIGVYPAKAGHDYQSLAKTNFRHKVVERDGKPTLIKRS